MIPGLALYIGGVVVGLFACDARPAARLALAMLWPLGPVAFILTLAFLGVVAAIAFPVVGIGAAAAAGAAWWLWS
jgi:hypothetical protein